MVMLSELPDSMMVKSLIRLPVKSLMLCRCVCKSWYNLVSDPYFICLHLSQQSIDKKGYLLTAHQKNSPLREQYSFRCDETFLEKLILERPISESRGAFSLVGCAKGLLLMLNPGPSDSDLHLWNPGLHRIKPLPSAPATYKYMFHREALGFAFLPDICDYKVIRIFDFFSDYDGVAGFAEIYSLKTDSWRRIETPTPVMRLSVLPRAPLVASFVNSVFYWVVPTYQDNHRTDCILSFNMKCETFKMTGLPVACLEQGCVQGSLEVFQESLYLFVFHVGKDRSLWIMKENCSCELYWLKICMIEYLDRWPVGFMKNGDVILEDVERKVSLHDPRNMCSPRNSECEMGWELRISKAYNYSPSLALLE
ncbi:F-box protein CPR1-like isoform X2 [Apium graveolens]